MKPFVVQTPMIPAKRKKGAKPGEPRKIAWRRKLHSAILQEKTRRGYKKLPADQKVKVNFVIYLMPNLLRRMDVDNIAKGVLDALQGRLAGERKNSQKTRRKALIANDNQVHQLHIVKRPIRGERGLGKLSVTPFT
jgi:Holliday junction resolvase RusA-like endonuclease